MVVSNREIANINPFKSSSALSCPTDINKELEDINMDLSRGRSPRSSVNSSRESSVISKLSNDVYFHQMEIQSEDLNWAN